MAKRSSRKSALPTVLTYLGLAAGLVFACFPILWMFFTSLKSNTEIFALPPRLLPDEFTLVAYRSIFGDPAKVRFFINSYLVAGVVTFRRAEQLREAAATVPLERLLVETDAPYLTPEPYRKIRRNEPRFVVETARKVAEVRGIGYEELAAATSRNFCALFDLPVPG